MIKVDNQRLNFLIESRNDITGKTSYVIHCSLGRLRFRNMSSVLDFIEMNKDIGFIV